MRRHIKLCIVLGLALVTLALMALDRTHMQADDTLEAQQGVAAERVPDVAFTLLDGGTVKLRSLAGHRVLLHFWASWCVPCGVEFGPLLQSMAESKNTILLAVSGDTKPDNVRTFLAPYRHDYKALFESHRVLVANDPDHHLIEGVFQTFQYPETIVIGPDQRMQQKVAGIYIDKK